jgi:hypothetical protein
MTPISFSEFIKDPVKAILFLALVAIIYLYVDNKMVYQTQIQKQESRIEKLELEVKLLQEKLLETTIKINE